MIARIKQAIVDFLSAMKSEQSFNSEVEQKQKEIQKMLQEKKQAILDSLGNSELAKTSFLIQIDDKFYVVNQGEVAEIKLINEETLATISSCDGRYDMYDLPPHEDI